MPIFQTIVVYINGIQPEYESGDGVCKKIPKSNSEGLTNRRGCKETLVSWLSGGNGEITSIANRDTISFDAGKRKVRDSKIDR